MHAMKVSLIGQTYALAKCSDSGGKKSRIRRSKEERKALAETFIKKYQESNNGNFPSLNLAHKEVGGSFYTVREIVREIIQENRVLGPAKLSADEQKDNQFHEQYPLGSISIEPRGHKPPTNDSHSVSSHNQSICEEVVYTSSSLINGQQQQRLDSSLHINGILVEGGCEEADGSKSSVHLDNEMLITDAHNSQKTKIVEKVVNESTSKVTHFATDVIVEIFPVQSSSEMIQKTVESSSGMIQKTDENYVEVTELAGKMEGLEIKNVEVELQPIKSNFILDEMDSINTHSSGPVDEKSDEKCADLLSENLSYSPGSKSTTSSTLESEEIQIAVSCTDDLTVQTTVKSQIVLEIEPNLATKDADPKSNIYNTSSTQTESLSQEEIVTETRADNRHLSTKDEGKDADPKSNIYNTSSTQTESLSQEEIVTETRADNRHASTKDEGKNSTLNRTKLESWEGASKTRAEDIPVWAAFKAFITAFLKFWTE